MAVFCRAMLRTDRMFLQAEMPRKRTGHCCGIIVGIVVFSFVCFGLAVSNTSAAFDACGHRLWDTVLAAVFMYMAAQALLWGALNVDMPDQTRLMCSHGTTILCSIMASLLTVFSHDAMASPDCYSALSNNSIGKPVLAQMAIVEAVAFYSGVVYVPLRGCVEDGRVHDGFW